VLAFLPSSLLTSLFVVTLIAIFSAAAGVRLTSVHALSRRMVPFSGGVLIGVALFWVLPEMAEFFGWPWSIAWIGAGFVTLFLVDRFVYPLCPACSGTHEHEHCATELHGFATPLLAAAALHSAIDGWSLAAAHSATGTSNFGRAFVIGIAFHKIPEGIALGAITRAALPSRWSALGWCAAAQSATLVAGCLEMMFAPHLNERNLHALLAIAGGSFLYLGGHAVHGEIRRSGKSLSIMEALTGVAMSSALRLFAS
jgi:zinc and cadmium transporter